MTRGLTCRARAPAAHVASGWSRRYRVAFRNG
jgi:hypothetical protein